MADEAETERVTFTIANLRTVNSKSLYALVDVEVQVAGPAAAFRLVCRRTVMSTAPGGPWSKCPKSCSGRSVTPCWNSSLRKAWRNGDQQTSNSDPCLLIKA